MNTTNAERRARLLELSERPRRGVRRFTAEQEAEILGYVDDPAEFSHTDIARVFANDPNDAREVKNVSLVIGNIVKRRAKTLAANGQEAEVVGEFSDLEEEDAGRPATAIVTMGNGRNRN